MITNNIVKEIFKMNKRTGFGYGLTICGELFLGYANSHFGLEFFKDTEENMSYVKSRYELEKKYS